MSMATIERPNANASLFQQAIDFAWAEADMLDRLDYKPWLTLWTEGGRYIVPVERDAADYADVLNIVYDDQAMRAARVKRLLSGFSMSSAPPARTVRTVSRFVVLEESPDSIRIRAAQHIVEYKYERTRILAADVTYRLVVEDGLRLDQKIVALANAEDFQFGIGYLL